MTDLLVESLMADGGLESALSTAVKFELEEIEYAVLDYDFQTEERSVAASMPIESLYPQQFVVLEDPSYSVDIPLLCLVKQLLRSATSQTLTKLQNCLPKNMTSSSIKFDKP
ncbi:E3 ubiquitin-protein ligase HERC2, partial [Stegodyphus mimosarum]